MPCLSHFVIDKLLCRYTLILDVFIKNRKKIPPTTVYKIQVSARYTLSKLFAEKQ